MCEENKTEDSKTAEQVDADILRAMSNLTERSMGSITPEQTESYAISVKHLATARGCLLVQKSPSTPAPITPG